MRKLFLAFVLLVLIVGVSYIKAVRDDAKSDSSFTEGQKSGQRERLELKNEAESLRYSIGQREVDYAESLTNQHVSQQKDIDSLTDIIEKQGKNIVELRKKATIAQKKADLTKKSKSGANRHKELLAYYQKRHQALPGDLADYERRVAVSEIRTETARKFSVTLAELNRIRLQHSIDY